MGLIETVGVDGAPSGIVRHSARIGDRENGGSRVVGKFREMLSLWNVSLIHSGGVVIFFGWLGSAP